MRIKCPTCSRVLEGQPAELPYRPFCCERCRSVDLGNWLDSSYRISRPVDEEELDQGMPTEGEAAPKRPPN